MTQEKQLLHCIRNAIKQAMQCDDDSQRKTLLAAAEILANELLLREDCAFYINRYNRGRQLLMEGLKHLPGDGTVLFHGIDYIPDVISEEMSKQKISKATQQLTTLLKNLITLLPTTGNPQLTAYLDEVVSWEVGLYQRQMETVAEPDLQVNKEAVITAQGFEDYLRGKFPDKTDIRVTGFTPLSGGFSKTTILVETHDSDSGHQYLVIRAERSRAVIELYSERVVDEFPIVRLAWEAGLCVPEPLWVESDKSLLGTCFIVSRKASGRNVGSSIGTTEEITPSMIASLAKELARIHRVDLSLHTEQMAGTILASQWLSARDVAKGALDVVSYWRWMGENAGSAPSALIERGLRWLEDNILPCDQPPALLHGDYGLHNVMIENDRVTAVIDWEVCHIGDPAEEISWLLSSAGGKLDEKEFLRLYFQAGGPPISEYRLRYFDVFQCVKMSISALAALKTLDRRLDNPQLPVFGLRYIHTHASHLTQAIEQAENAREKLLNLA